MGHGIWAQGPDSASLLPKPRAYHQPTAGAKDAPVPGRQQGSPRHPSVSWERHTRKSHRPPMGQSEKRLCPASTGASTLRRDGSCSPRAQLHGLNLSRIGSRDPLHEPGGKDYSCIHFTGEGPRLGGVEDLLTSSEEAG